MTDRERLIELLQNVPADYEGNRGVGAIADHILADGWIRPPCKVGDTVYQIDDVRIYQGTVVEIVLNKLHTICVADIICFDERAIGKTVFLTREEAEKALAERQDKMKNLDFKMRERFHRREQDMDRQLERECKELAKMKAAHYAEDTDGVSEKDREHDEVCKRLKALKERETK